MIRTRAAAATASATAAAVGLAACGSSKQAAPAPSRPPAATAQQGHTGMDAVAILQKIHGMKLEPGAADGVDVHGVLYADRTISRPGEVLGRHFDA